MGRRSNHLHVWNSLLERAGFTLADVPKEWEAFWSFWCDQVQPAVRKALGRDDIWGVGLPMSAAAIDTDDELVQFQLAYEAPWLDRDRRLQVDDPAVRAGMIKALEAYTAIWRKGCTPPDSVSWTNVDNNKAFLAQTVVMTANTTLSIPAALRTARPDDYYKNAATIDWPDGANGQPLVIDGAIVRAVVFKAGSNPALAGDFVRFLAEEGWLAHWLDLRRRPIDAADAQAGRAAVLARPERPAPHARGHPDPDPAAPASNMDVRDNEWRSGRDLGGERLGQRRPPRRRRGHQPRAGGRRGDRADQADPERVAWPVSWSGCTASTPPSLDQTFWWRGQRSVCGTMSLAALEALIAGVKVRCEVVERDRHGRPVAKVFSPNRVDIGRRLVSTGWA